MRRFMRGAGRLVGAGFVLLAALSAGGCWDYRDVNERSIVLGLAVDAGPNEMHDIAIELATPVGMERGGGGGPRMGGGKGGGGAGAAAGVAPRTVLEHRGSTSSFGMSELDAHWTRPFSFGHLAILILGEEYSRRGETDEFGCSGCHPEMSTAENVVVAAGNAAEFLRRSPPTETFSALFIQKQMREALDRLSIPESRTVSQVAAAMNEWGVGLLPRLSWKKGMPYVGGAAVMRRYVFVGWLTEKEVIGYNLLRAEGRRGPLEVKCPALGGDSRMLTFTYLISTKGSRLRIEEREGQPVVKYQIRVSGIAMDTSCREEPTRAEQLMEKEVVKEVLDHAYAVIRKAQGMGMDFLALGLEIRRRHPFAWRRFGWDKNWERDFPSLPIEVEAKAIIKRHGLFH